MKIFIIFIVSFCFVQINLSAQNKNLYYFNNGSGKKFYEGTMPISKPELKLKLKSYTDSKNYLENANICKTFIIALPIAGSIIVAKQIKRNKIYGEPKLGNVLLGLCMIGSSIPLLNNYKKSIHRSLKAYNSHLPNNSFLPKAKLDFCIYTNSIGLLLQF